MNKRFEDSFNKKEALRIDNVKKRSKRTPQQQMLLLDERLGKDQGAVKERARLKKQIEELQTVVKEETPKTKKGKKKNA